jgi:predicted GNAT family acetyltransferase
MSYVIEHDRVVHRFHTDVEGVSSVLDYSLSAGVMTITRTNVPTEVGGRGIASALVQAAVDAAHSEGWKIVPACSYAAAWMRRHPPLRGAAGLNPLLWIES